MTSGFYIADAYAVRCMNFYGDVIGVYVIMRYHFMTKKDMYARCQVSKRGCTGA